MARRPTEALAEWLDRRIQDGEPGEQLPTGKELAKTFGLSELTVKKVLKGYNERGLVTRIRGKGTFIPGGEVSPQSRIESPRSSTDVLFDHLDELICGGALKRGDALPSVKSLSLQFKVTPATVIASYRKLQDIGRVVKVGKTFWVGSFQDILFPSPKKEVYFLYDTSEDLSQTFRSGVLSMAYQKMQNELLVHGYVFRFQTFAEMPGLLDKWRRKGVGPYGIVMYRLEASAGPGLVLQLVNFLRKARRELSVVPRVLLDWETTAVHLEFSQSVHNLLRGHVSTSAARALADYVASRAFRDVVFFTGLTERVWNTDWIWALLKARTELEARDARAETRFVVKELPDDFSEGDINPVTAREILDDGAILYNTQQWINKYKQHVLDRVVRHIKEDEMVQTKDYSLVFERYRGSDVWIFSTDAEAVGALKWAREHGIAVPRDLAIIGLENNPAHFVHGLSTCIPDWEAIGYLMAQCIIGDVPVKKTRKGFLATRASFLERLTTP
jgi:DNA-binding transcriptional regulator YhcF (GntR family)